MCVINVSALHASILTVTTASQSWIIKNWVTIPGPTPALRLPQSPHVNCPLIT